MQHAGWRKGEIRMRGKEPPVASHVTKGTKMEMQIVHQRQQLPMREHPPDTCPEHGFEPQIMAYFRGKP
jgi:hypothetical protein